MDVLFFLAKYSRERSPGMSLAQLELSVTPTFFSKNYSVLVWGDFGSNIGAIRHGIACSNSHDDKVWRYLFIWCNCFVDTILWEKTADQPILYYSYEREVLVLFPFFFCFPWPFFMETPILADKSRVGSGCLVGPAGG